MKYSRAFNSVLSSIQSLLKDREKLLNLVAKAIEKIIKIGGLSKIVNEVKTMCRFVKATAIKKYIIASKINFALIVAALVYFVMPIDAIPDSIPVAGYFDDAAVFKFVISKVVDELQRFKAWELNRQN